VVARVKCESEVNSRGEKNESNARNRPHSKDAAFVALDLEVASGLARTNRMFANGIATAVLTCVRCIRAQGL
jgi:hypothetical protein